MSSGGVKALDIFVRSGDNHALIRNRRHSTGQERRASKSSSTLAGHLSVATPASNNDDVGYHDDDDGTADTLFNSPA